MSDGAGSTRESGKSEWFALVERAIAAFKPIILTAGGLVGFVAFAGSVIVWSRFYAAKVPADQAVAAFPRAELIAIASSILLLFGFVGLLAVLTFFLVERKGRATLPMCRALLALLAVEGIVAIMLVEDPSPERTIFAIEMLLFPGLVALWVTFTKGYVKGEDEARDTGKLGEERVVHTIGDSRRVFAGELLVRRLIGSALIALIAAAAVVAFDGFGLLAPIVAISAFAISVNLYVIKVALLDVKVEPDDDGDEFESESQPLTRPGVAVFLAMMALVAVLPALVMWKFWLFISLVAAAILAAGLWRIAILSNGVFRWYGVAVFISVPLFGTLTGMARNLDDPQVQPMALIRHTDGPDEAIQGLYVTESDKRVYFATVATEGCDNELAPHSGRLLWVPKSEVAAMAIGPLQDISDAARTALEMSYSLTPAVETPAGDRVSLTVAEKRTEVEDEPVPSEKDQRLENAGVAVQPNFGRGLTLHPESASPGEVVTLRLSAPNRNNGIEGFGRTREGRTLRLGGVRVDVVKEEAHNPREAEYVETADGRELSLAKGKVYTNEGDGYRELEPGEDRQGARYVKVGDDSVARVDDGALASERFLRLQRSALTLGLTTEDKPGWRPQVTLTNGQTVPLRLRLLRQAWHEDSIKFRVPLNAATGAVTVECEQLAGQPLLRVPNPPVARIAVSARPGSNRVRFDSRRSSDDGRVISRRWSIDGVPSGYGRAVAESMPLRPAVYTVRLSVTDNVGQTDVAQARLMRLPVAKFGVDGGGEPTRPRVVRRVRKTMMRTLRDDLTAGFEFDGHSYGDGSAAQRADRSLRDAERVRAFLLSSSGASASTSVPGGGSLEVPVKMFGYGANCPLGDGPRNARIDLFVLSEGVHVVPGRRCRPDRVRGTSWRPSAAVP